LSTFFFCRQPWEIWWISKRFQNSPKLSPVVGIRGVWTEAPTATGLLLFPSEKFVSLVTLLRPFPPNPLAGSPFSLGFSQLLRSRPLLVVMNSMTWTKISEPRLRGISVLVLILCYTKEAPNFTLWFPLLRPSLKRRPQETQ